MRNEPKLFFTTYDLARFTGTDSGTVLKWLQRGLLPVSRTAGGHRRLPADGVRAFLAALNMPLPPELGGTGSTVRVLLVDADARFVAATASGLRRAKPDWDVQTQTSGIEALLGMAAAAPVVLAIDLELTDVDALAAIRAATRRAPLAPRLVVALTARASRSAASKAIEAGARRVIQKPVSGAALAKQLEDALANDFAGLPASV